MDQIVLSVPALLPLIGGLALLFVSQFGPLKKAEGAADGRTRRDRLLQLYVEGIALANSLVLLWLVFSASGEGVVLFRLYGELKVMFRLDGMGRVFAGLIGVLWPLAVLYAFEYMKEERRKAAFFAYYLMTYGITAGIALAGNLMTLYLFYELLTLATFPLVLFPLTREAARASRKYLYYSIGGAAFAFLGLVFVLYFSSTGNTAFSAGGMLDLEAAGQHKDLLLFIYLLAFYGFGVKAVVFPCHKWLPPATVAPTPVTALLHAVAVVKSGAFAILRLTYYSFGAGFLKDTWAQWVVMAAAMMTIAYGSTMAAKEAHWKRRLAYSTVSNLSYILLGASMMSPLGLAAALSHMVFHAFMKICAFFCAGAVMHQTGKTHVYELDGLGRRMPVTFGCLTVASLSLTGIPLFAGFISKWNIARAAFTCGMGPTVPLGGMVGYLGTGGWRLLAFGAVAVLLLVAVISRYVKNILGVLIMGVMIGYIAGAVIQILQYLSSAEQLKMFYLWSMGSLGHVTSVKLWIMWPMVALGLLLAVYCMKPLNLLLLGEQYARTMGIDVRRARTLIFVSTTLLTGTVTAFCGPVGFLGLAVPHVARMFFHNADHRVLLPGSMLLGILAMLVCDIIAKTWVLPINSITALLGIPVIVWVVYKNLRFS